MLVESHVSRATLLLSSILPLALSNPADRANSCTFWFLKSCPLASCTGAKHSGRNGASKIHHTSEHQKVALVLSQLCLDILAKRTQTNQLLHASSYLLECKPLQPYWSRNEMILKTKLKGLKTVFLFHLKCYKETCNTIYLCFRHALRFAVLGGQDLLEEHFWLFHIDKLNPRLRNLLFFTSSLDRKQTIIYIYLQ